MDQTASQIERHIEEQRQELRYHVSELQNRVRNVLDWRVQFQERPAVMLTLAFAGGLLLSRLLPGRSAI